MIGELLDCILTILGNHITTAHKINFVLSVDQTNKQISRHLQINLTPQNDTMPFNYHCQSKILVSCCDIFEISDLYSKNIQIAMIDGLIHGKIKTNQQSMNIFLIDKKCQKQLHAVTARTNDTYVGYHCIWGVYRTIPRSPVTSKIKFTIQTNIN